MKQALYRNYRPRSFKELIGQEHVTKTLQQAIKTGRISHAYLFTGPRGVGKTSAARILAHEVNGFDYKGESAQLDIIEIDAASNRRIDEIRDLRDKVRIAPTSGKYKVYIIDEVHMLTREAFNALLKTLEEPPAHAIFILATTEAHKLPETIISRTQRFEFKPVAGAQAAKHLRSIAKSEKITVSPEALTLLADFGAGSFRDSISYLDQLSAGGAPITEDDVRKALGMPSDEAINQLLAQAMSGDSQAVLKTIYHIKQQGIDASAAASALSRQIRTDIVGGDSQPVLVGLLKQLIEVPASAKPYDYLEISLLEASGQVAASGPAETSVKVAQPKSVPSVIAAKTVDKPMAKKQINFEASIWPAVVSNVRERAASLYTALRLAKPEFLDEAVILKFEFPLHQRKIDQAANKQLIANLIEDLTGRKVKIDCTVDKAAFSGRDALVPSSKPPKPEPPESNLHSINSIFGMAEAVET